MTDNTMWEHVRKPEMVGSVKEKRLETVEPSTSDKCLFDVLCNVEEQRAGAVDMQTDDEEEEDDDNISIVSSCLESVANEADMEVEEEDGPGDVETWAELDEGEREGKIKETLKKLGNIKKKKMSPLLLKDHLGADGLLTLRNIKKKHEKEVNKEKRKIEEIYLYVKYFDQKMKKRRKNLECNIKMSNENTYERKKYQWRDAYDCFMKDKRQC